MSEGKGNSNESARPLTGRGWCEIRPMTLPGELNPPREQFKSLSALVDWIRGELDFIQNGLPKDTLEELSDEELRNWYLTNLSGIAGELVQLFELTSFRGREAGAKCLFKLARDSSEALNREVRRGNDYYSKILPDCTTWPSMFSPHPQIQRVLTSDLKRLGMGTNSLPAKSRMHWEHGSKRLVTAIFDYCEELNRETQWWKNSPLHPARSIPDLVKKIWNLPRPLCSKNWKDWRAVGYEVLDHATGGNGKTYKGKPHPAFQKEPLKDLDGSGDDWTDQISKAWRDLAEIGPSSRF